jgi:hypothetical protein
MSGDGQGPGAGNIIAGVVLILFGLCILLVGGGCTIFWLVLLSDQSSWGSGMGGGVGMLAISVVAAAVGLFAIVKGVQQFRTPRGGG